MPCVACSLEGQEHDKPGVSECVAEDAAGRYVVRYFHLLERIEGGQASFQQDRRIPNSTDNVGGRIIFWPSTIFNRVSRENHKALQAVRTEYTEWIKLYV